MARILAGTTMVLATSLTTATAGPGVAPAAAVTPGPNGRIAFVTGSSVSSVNPDGTAQDLEYFIGTGADPSAYLSAPVWSPDGNRLAFTNYTGTNGTRMIFGDAGRNEWTYVHLNFATSNPTWSPDGKRIAFDSGPGDIYIIDADGTNLVRLTRHSSSVWGDENPDWSPDGQNLVVEFRSSFTSTPRIDLISVDDGTRTATSVFGHHPAWSPDGTKIAYSALRGSDNDIFTMNADGTGATPRTGSFEQETWPTWSPDGTQIAFQVVESDGDIVIRRFPLETGIVVPVGFGEHPNWGAAQAVCRGRNATVTGTAGPDVLRGSTGDDIFQGLAGNDTILGGGGHDIICGGAGVDTASYAGHTSDVTAVIGPTALRAEDDIHTDVENLTGGAGDDRLIGSAGNNRLTGGRGDDVLKGGDGDDVLTGEGGEDLLKGADGDDDLSGVGGDDILRGSDGADWLNGGADGDLLAGGPGVDEATYGAHPAVVNVSIGDGRANDGGRYDGAAGYRDEVVASTEDVIGSANNDILLGNDLDNELNGGAGDDTITGGTGADQLLGGAGRDVLRAADDVRDLRIDCGADTDAAAQFDAGLDPAPISCS